MPEYRLSLRDLSSVTADTTAAYINVFDTVPFFDINPCFGHKGNLFLKLACTEKSTVLRETFTTCRQVMVRLDGKKSHLQKDPKGGRLKTDLTEAVEGLKAARKYHMWYDYYNFPSIRVVEFLDVDVFHTVPLSEWWELCADGSMEDPVLILNFLLEKDSVSPAEIAR